MEDQKPTQSPIQTPIETIARPAKKKFLNKKWLVLGLIVLILILIGTLTGFLFLNSNKQIACTTEAKLCPDGSSADRTGPKCEFAKCPYATPTPTVKLLDTSNWKTYVNNNYNYQIKYPLSKTEPYSEKYEGNIETTCLVNFQKDGGCTVFITTYPNTTVNQQMDIQKNYDHTIQDYENTGKKIEYRSKKEEYGYKKGELVNITVYLQNGIDVFEIYGNIFKEGVTPVMLEAMLNTLKFTDQTSPTPTCRPRPACLDATPRCLIPETEDMCPSTITPSP